MKSLKIILFSFLLIFNFFCVKKDKKEEIPVKKIEKTKENFKKQKKKLKNYEMITMTKEKLFIIGRIKGSKWEQFAFSPFP